MPTTRDIETFQPLETAAGLDRDDPSLGELKFLVEKGWYKFQLSRSDLQRLADDLQKALAATVGDLPEG